MKKKQEQQQHNKNNEKSFPNDYYRCFQVYGIETFSSIVRGSSALFLLYFGKEIKQIDLN